MDSVTIQNPVRRLKVFSARIPILCFAVLTGILVAGLLPFHSPRNNVRWVADGGGLSLGKYGLALTAQPFRNDKSKANAPCSFEIWLEPARVDRVGTILAFYQPNGIAQISLRQFKKSLVFGRGNVNYQQRKFSRIYVEDVFQTQNPVLVSITTGPSATVVYADGLLLRGSPTVRLSREDFAGQLMFGNAPGTTDVWSGTLKGFALYDRELSSDEVHQHFVSWTHHDEKALVHSTGVVAVYPFDESSGTVAHNEVDPSTNLLTPDRFFVPHKPFLEAPWNEFHPNRSYFKSLLLNVVGFVPLGFVFCTLFYSASEVRHPIFSTIATGLAVSLTIEVLQGFLPTRTSGTTDLFTNTLGTALGAIAYTSPSVRACIAKAVRYAPMVEDNVE